MKQKKSPSGLKSCGEEARDVGESPSPRLGGSPEFAYPLHQGKSPLVHATVDFGLQHQN